MVALLDSLCLLEGPQPSGLDGVKLLRVSRATGRTPVLYEPCLAIVAQGRKRFFLPDHELVYDAQRFLMLTVPVPADCVTEVDDGPFLAFTVRIDLTVVSELLVTLGASGEPARGRTSEGPTTPAMLPAISATAVRLLESLRSEGDARVLGPSLVRELLYRVLTSEHGEPLRALLLGDENRARIHRILERMHLDYAAPLDLSSLARGAGMSSSALHAHFRAVTSTSPVQYLKTLRLYKAREMLVQSSLRAGAAAERVGYTSVSQFSREFRRQFGASPVEEAQRVRATFGLTDP